MDEKINIEKGLEEKAEFLLGKRAHLMDYHLGVSFLKVFRNELRASMPVTEKTRQPFGLLHGGASVVLAESLATCAAWLNIDEKKYTAVGVEINANHVRSVKEGIVYGTVRPLHRGRSLHVWQTEIHDEQDRLVSVSRCTVAILDMNASSAGK